jgi:hypothetical protein
MNQYQKQKFKRYKKLKLFNKFIKLGMSIYKKNENNAMIGF